MRTLAAIMFTDITGYTALMQQDEREALLIRNAHRKYFNELTSKYEGRILQYYGDGTLSIFNSAHQAVLCGIELQRAFRKGKQIPVRIGIHTGEIIFDEEDIIGDAVNIASRIESLAATGSVLLSEKVYEEIRNNKEFRVKPLGRCQLKNVFEPVGIYAVVDEALHIPERNELGGARESCSRIFDLPVYPNAFIGRAHHLHSVTSLLQKNATRLITLHGPGGMGKTRLSVRVGELSADLFEHGVCFVPLDVVTDHEQAPLYIGHRLGLKENFGRSWIDVIIDFLENRHLLLILDNLEQIPGSAAAIARILDACPGVKILATSREVLGIAHEIEYPLDSLNRPNPNLFPGPEDLLKFDAIDLFVQKARYAIPGFRLTGDNAAAVVKICHELEGLPLPIELAAARVKLFSPEVILKKLEQNQDLLKTRSKDVAFRHQTIRNTVKWSYDLLDAEEQQLFQQLSMFRGGFTPDSLEAVCPDADSLEVIESFINKSLIVKGEEVHYVPRFRMLKLIRDYGLEQLEKNPEKDTFFRHFTGYFLSFSEEGRSKLQSPEQAKWIALFEAEFENLAAALEWLIVNQPEKACRMGAEIWRFYLNRGFLREGLVLVEPLLSLPVKEKATTASLLEAAGVLSHNLGDYTGAKDYFKRCLDLCRGLEDKVEVAKALNNLGWAEWRIGNYAHAISYSENALEIFAKLNDRRGQAKSLNNLAWTYLSKGWFDQAEGLQRKVLAIHSQLNNDRGVAFAKTNLGRALVRTGKMTEAAQMIDEGIRLFEMLKDRQMMAFSRVAKAELFYEQKDPEAAGKILQNACLPDFKTIGDLWGMALSHYLLGRVFFLQEDFGQAEFHLTGARDLYQISHDKFGQASTNLWLSKINWRREDPSTAENNLKRSLTLAAEMEAKELLKDGHLERAFRALQQENPASALKFLAVADHYARELGDYEYQKFRSKIRPDLAGLRQSLVIENTRVAPGVTADLELEEAYLAKPLEKEKLKKRIQKLLMSHEDLPFSGPQESTDHELGQGPPPATGVADDPFVRQVRQVVEKHLMDPHFTVKDLCREVGMSHSQLHRRLSALTGLSVTRFIRSIRLAKARELLLDPKLTVAAVAYDTGFKDPDYFYRVFKRAFKMTPNEFRNSEKK